MYKNRIVVVVILASVSFFILRHCSGVGVSVVETLSSSVLYPLLRIQQLVVEPITNRLKRFSTVRDLEKSIKSLQEKYEEVFAENVALKARQNLVDEIAELHHFNKKYLVNRGSMVQILARHFHHIISFFSSMQALLTVLKRIW